MNHDHTQKKWKKDWEEREHVSGREERSHQESSKHKVWIKGRDQDDEEP